MFTITLCHEGQFPYYCLSRSPGFERKSLCCLCPLWLMTRRRQSYQNQAQQGNGFVL